MERLKDDTDVAASEFCQLIFIEIVESGSGNGDLSRRTTFQTRQGHQQGRFARS